jgi:hypothetical protein
MTDSHPAHPSLFAWKERAGSYRWLASEAVSARARPRQTCVNTDPAVKRNPPYVHGPAFVENEERASLNAVGRASLNAVGGG